VLRPAANFPLSIARIPPLWIAFLGVIGLAASCSRPSALPPRPDLTGRPPALVAAIVNAERAAGTSPAARLELGRVYHANGFSDAAQAYYMPLVSHPNFGAQTLYYLADLALNAGDAGKAVRLLQDVVAKVPDYLPAQLRLAELRYKTGDAVRAGTLYATVLQRDTAQPEALLAQARERLRAGDTPGAAALLERLLTAHPEHSAGSAMLAQLVEQRGNEHRAALLRHRARARKDPPTADPWLDLVALQSFDVSQVAMRLEDYVKAGRIDDAMVWLKRLETLEPNHPAVCEVRGLSLIQQGRHADAAREYERAIAAGVDPARMYPPLVAALVAQQRFDEAEHKARAGLAAAPRAPALHVSLAQLEQRKANLLAATRLLDDALALEPRHAAANRARALIWWQQGQPEKAIPLLEIVVEASPADTAAAGMLGQYFLERGRAADAVRALEQAHAVDPRSENIAELFGLALLRVGNDRARARRFEEAVAFYDRALLVQPKLAEGYVNKAQVCLHLGRAQPAEEAVRELARLEPAHPRLSALRAALTQLSTSTR
jgi:tetratricopeptide (TPR) repeat protein